MDPPLVGAQGRWQRDEAGSWHEAEHGPGEEARAATEEEERVGLQLQLLEPVHGPQGVPEREEPGPGLGTEEQRDADRVAHEDSQPGPGGDQPEENVGQIGRAHV